MTTHALFLANQIFNRVSTVPGFVKMMRAPALTINSADLPALGVFILEERWQSDGDENAGTPHFKHVLVIGITTSCAATAPEDQLALIEDQADQCIEKILKDASFFNQKWIDGILSISRRLAFTRVGETPLAEQQIRMEITFGTTWEPVIPDVLEEVNFETRYPDATTSPDEVQQVKAVWPIPTT